MSPLAADVPFRHRPGRLCRARALILFAIATSALGGCDVIRAIAAAEVADARYRESIAAELELEVVIVCTPVGEQRFAPCGEHVELVFTHTTTGQSARSSVTAPGPMEGALPEGEYELAVRIDGMRMGLAWTLGPVRLHAGSQALGTLVVRFVELPGGTFEAQAREAERLRDTYGLTAADFLSSPTRGLLLLDAHLEGPPT